MNNSPLIFIFQNSCTLHTKLHYTSTSLHRIVYIIFDFLSITCKVCDIANVAIFAIYFGCTSGYSPNIEILKK